MQYVPLKRSMSIYDHIRRSAAHTGQFWRIESELLRTTSDANGGRQYIIRSLMVQYDFIYANADHVWSRICSMNDLVDIKAEVRNVGFRYQVMSDMACEARLYKFSLKWHRKIHHIFLWWDMINSGHISAYITSFDQFWLFRWGLIVLRWRCQVSANVARNGA